MPMFAIYNKNNYLCSKVGEEYHLVTHVEEKVDDSFQKRFDYFVKKIDPSDEGIEAVYNIHFFVHYHDEIEKDERWCVDLGAPLHDVPDIEKGEVGLYVDHQSKGHGWTTCDKCAASKIIELRDCDGFSIETTYLKRNFEVLLEEEVEIRKVSASEFQSAMLAHRARFL